jgi:hypothetical protein
MSKFRITYDNPQYEGGTLTAEVEFSDWSGLVNGHEINISARLWAEDYAYSLSDKGDYNIQEIG